MIALSPSISAFCEAQKATATAQYYSEILRALERFVGQELRPELATEDTVVAFLKRRPASTQERDRRVINLYLKFYDRPRIITKFPDVRPRIKCLLEPADVSNLLSKADGELRAILALVYSGLSTEEALEARLVGDSVTAWDRRGRSRTVPIAPSSLPWVRAHPPPYPHWRPSQVLDAARGLLGKGITMRDLRRSFAVHLAQAGADARVLQAVLGDDKTSRDLAFSTARQKASRICQARTILSQQKPSSDD